jgi:hypothetical protein
MTAWRKRCMRSEELGSLVKVTETETEVEEVDEAFLDAEAEVGASLSGLISISIGTL